MFHSHNQLEPYNKKRKQHGIYERELDIWKFVFEDDAEEKDKQSHQGKTGYCVRS